MLERDTALRQNERQTPAAVQLCKLNPKASVACRWIFYTRCISARVRFVIGREFAFVCVCVFFFFRWNQRRKWRKPISEIVSFMTNCARAFPQWSYLDSVRADALDAFYVLILYVGASLLVVPQLGWPFF